VSRRAYERAVLGAVSELAHAGNCRFSEAQAGSNSCSRTNSGTSLVSELSGVSAVTRPPQRAGGCHRSVRLELGRPAFLCCPLAAIFLALAERVARIERRLEIAASPKN
jgi:hypothetical protein